MARIHRWFVMIYASMQGEFMETKYNSHDRRCYNITVFLWLGANPEPALYHHCHRVRRSEGIIIRRMTLFIKLSLSFPIF